ncbi:STAS domain-containing protein [Gloeothece verrucosa]|uniref:Anti-sigma factor antagonist n=1 Tax=Gloeothece verrucosa (strain PCC 7822) TaxID=497965 RepID=E0UB66_GLOV7|nr:STAS domain-containing protein [Gloeothece verrucosa]ADN16311.1 anti-sigma-factor antagonist [Gloeothece verrucosa PCC 7822]
MRSTVKSSKIITIEPAGYITAANISEFQEELTLSLTSGDHSVFLIDMTKVEFLDSAGLMALASAFRLAEKLGKRFSLCSIPPSVKIIFELTQLDRVLDIYESREAFEASVHLTPEMAA